jgi:hypothetical protein
MTPEEKKPDPDETLDDLASPACYMHEVDPAYFGLDGEKDAAKRNRPPAPDAPGSKEHEPDKQPRSPDGSPGQETER